MGGRNIYPTDIERAAAAADDVRAGNAVAVRLLAGADERAAPRVVPGRRGVAQGGRRRGRAADPQGRHGRVVSAVGVRPAEVVVLGPGTLPKTPSGKLRRAATGGAAALALTALIRADQP